MFDNRPPNDRDENEEQESREQIRWLRSLGDHEALFQFMDSEMQTKRGLEAAQALVELGDVRGLDHLIASLRSTNPGVRHQAENILIEINHPRGLRAIRDLRDRPGPPAQAAVGAKPETSREQFHDHLQSLNTDELVALWHERDRSRMPDGAVEVLSAILTDRLGSLPQQEDEVGDQIDQDVDPMIQDLWIQGDTRGLMRMYEDTSDARLQLEVAEALADLGDEDALDVLIEALDDSDQRISETAAEMLDWLDLPRGNRGLDERGIEFETDARGLFTESDSAVPAAPLPSHHTDPWAGPPQSTPTARIEPPLSARPLVAQTAAQQVESSAPSAGVVLVGAVGGLIGFIIFRFGLDLLGLLPIPSDWRGWLQPPALYYMSASILVGAASGVAGSRVAQAIGRRFGWEPAEGDVLPVLGALFEGVSLALVANFLIYSIIGF